MADDKFPTMETRMERPDEKLPDEARNLFRKQGQAKQPPPVQQTQREQAPKQDDPALTHESGNQGEDAPAPQQDDPGFEHEAGNQTDVDRRNAFDQYPEETPGDSESHRGWDVNDPTVSESERQQDEHLDQEDWLAGNSPAQRDQVPEYRWDDGLHGTPTEYERGNEAELARQQEYDERDRSGVDAGQPDGGQQYSDTGQQYSDQQYSDTGQQYSDTGSWDQQQYSDSGSDTGAWDQQQAGDYTDGGSDFAEGEGGADQGGEVYDSGGDLSSDSFTE